jgi:hypothetical protein
MAQRLLQTAAARFFPGSSPGPCFSKNDCENYALMKDNNKIEEEKQLFYNEEFEENKRKLA